MVGNGKVLTIKEASELAGVTESYIYKLIRKGAMSFEPVHNQDRTTLKGGQNQDKTIKKVKEVDIIRLFCLSKNQRTEPGQNQDRTNPLTEQNRTELKDTIKEVIEDYFHNKETQLMKPLEEIATYKLGKIEAENQFLKDRLESVLQENEELRTSIKALPGPPVEILTRLEKQSQQIQRKDQEKEELEKGKKKLEEKQNQKDLEINKLKETIKAQAEEVKEKENHFKKEEEDYIATIEAFKVKLEEEQKRPWWKRIFS